jgi:hypothetical protein
MIFLFLETINFTLLYHIFKVNFPFKVVPYTSGKIWSARLIFLFFGSVFEYIHCNKYQIFNNFQPTDSEL